MSVAHFPVELLLVIPVGILVSLDVMVLTVCSMARFQQGETPVKWSLLHATTHAAFLAAGIGLFSLLMNALHGLFQLVSPTLERVLKRLLDWAHSIAQALGEFLSPVVKWLIQMLPLLPELLAVVLSVGLCCLLYRAKLRRAAGETIDGELGFSRVFHVFGARIYAAAVVAMDMWYLTPTLRGIINSMADPTKFVFVLMLFVVVFFAIRLAIHQFQRPMTVGEEDSAVVATLLVVFMILLEPIGVFYFAFYAAWKVVNPTVEHHIGFLLASVTVTYLLIRGRFLPLVRTQLSMVQAALRVRHPGA